MRTVNALHRLQAGSYLLWLGAAMVCSALAVAAEPRPLVIAHRGASGYLPEHTLAAKAYAHALCADFIEQDLVLTKDDVPVVLHDIYLDTVSDVATRFPDRKRADGRYYALDFTLAEIKQLRVAERFNAKTGAPVYAKRYASAASPSEFRVSTLEEELQLIQGLNRSTGRHAGIYPEIKQPTWHREQGREISKIVLPILARYGYAGKDAPCFLQCFELTEVRRIRRELGWQGRIVMLLNARGKERDGVDHDRLCTAAGIKEIAEVADGIGPAIGRVVTWTATGERKVSDLVKLAHEAKLVVHGYTIRLDELPKGCPGSDELHAALFRGAGVDGMFSDFTDVTLAWLKK
ncbi:MAG: glycerophosphodiester phosphodiesterase [Verrucomicrobia bacterium]|nr:glycerophosphodiester phosphodiesterase [Verrucomicrobiota bacterium]